MNFKHMFRALRADEMVLIELEIARKALMEAQTAFEYSGALVKYNTDRVNRLEMSASAQYEALTLAAQAKSQAQVAAKAAVEANALAPTSGFIARLAGNSSSKSNDGPKGLAAA